MAEKDEFESKQKELESVAMPIMQKLYGGQGGMPEGFDPSQFAQGGPGQGPTGTGPSQGSTGKSSGPTVEEVD